MYTPKHLNKYVMPKSDFSYFGDFPIDECYTLYTITRDSDLLDNCNMEYIKAELPECETVQYLTFNHWACGWIETCFIHMADGESLIKADKIKEQLDNYPVLDEDDYSNKQYEAMDNNIQQAIKEYSFEDDNLTDETLEKIAYVISQKCNDFSENYWPSDNEISAAYETAINTKHCKICNTEYDTRHGYCNCQLSLF
jgi:hypothetical protein